jgi:hypothetical protein
LRLIWSHARTLCRDQLNIPALRIAPAESPRCFHPAGHETLLLKCCSAVVARVRTFPTLLPAFPYRRIRTARLPRRPLRLPNTVPGSCCVRLIPGACNLSTTALSGLLRPSSTSPFQIASQITGGPFATQICESPTPAATPHRLQRYCTLHLSAVGTAN